MPSSAPNNCRPRWARHDISLGKCMHRLARDTSTLVTLMSNPALSSTSATPLEISWRTRPQPMPEKT